MKAILIGAAIGATVAIVANLALGHGISDGVASALFCWAPIGALLGGAWASKSKVSERNVKKYKEQEHKDPTRYQP